MFLRGPKFFANQLTVGMRRQELLYVCGAIHPN